MNFLTIAVLLALTQAPAPAAPPVAETIVVTATRTETRVADTPASVVVVPAEALANSAAATVDDALRQVAGFTLFRRAGSRVANPTAQGVTLRGIGASGASRALVLDDGVPLNDPFGGWVFWGRVPRVALDRVEVLRGGGTDLYGSSAMGGVVQFIRKTTPALTIDVSGGSQETGSASFFTAMTRQDWSASLAADLFSTGGYVLVREGQRGAVDVEADSQHAALDATLRRGSAFVRASYYEEARANGTPLQENDTTIWQLSGGGDWRGLVLRAHASDHEYFQTFSAIAANRATERLTVEQNVPARAVGGSAQYSRGIGGQHLLVGGLELRRVEGESDELRFTPAGTFHVVAGGEQKTAAAFVETIAAPRTNLSLTAGVRVDAWNSESTETSLNPRLSLLYRANEALSLIASAYTAFRAPTLNELYRGFRVGNIETLPNAELQAEQLTAFEAGARMRNVRVTAFWMRTTDTIANVTLSQTPSTITRQRQNLGTTLSRGIEADAEWRFARDWRVSAGYLFADATVREGELEGNRIPQVPRHQATAQLQWRRIGAQLRWSASQYDDDLNQLPLGSYFVADLFAAQPIGRGMELTLAVENVTDQEVEVSATPVVTVGQPRAVRIGVRYSR
ncbi:MAG TPA: TonB-dependent receptor [Thermoanaerobaculia bacterium]|jgi:outer membrane receptor protein involved in Fe transport